MKFSFYLVFLLVLCSSVFAIGVSPPRYEIEFSPGLTDELPFTIINNAGQDITVTLWAKGDLAQYLTLPASEIDIPVNKKADITVDLALPDTIDTPGKNVIKIYIAQKIGGGSGVSAATGVIPMIYVYVPYPGRYAEITSFSVGDSKRGVNEGEDIQASFTVINRGEEGLTNTRAEAWFVDAEGSVFERVRFDDIALASQESYSQSFQFTTASLPPSDYVGHVAFYYDDVVRRRSQGFIIGTFDVSLTNYTHEFPAGTVSKGYLEVRNLWKGRLLVEASLSVPNVTSTSLPRASFGDFEGKRIDLFFDASNVPVGEYDGEVTFIIEKVSDGSQRTTIVPVRVSVVEPKKPERERAGLGMSALALVIVVMVLLLLVNMFFLGRMLLKKKGK